MSIFYDCGACLLVALFSGTLLFTLSAMGLLLWSGVWATLRWSRELAPVPVTPEAIWTPEPRAL